MSNAEIKLYKETLTNAYEVEKVKLRELCEYMESLENYFQEAERELSLRKNIF